MKSSNFSWIQVSNFINMKLTTFLTFDEYMNSHPFIDGIFALAVGLGIIIYSFNNIKYSEKRMKILKEEVQKDKSKFFNLGILLDVKWRAIMSILIGLGLIIYGIVVVIENVFL